MGKRFSSKKILLSMAAVGSAAAIAGLGTFATFSSTTNATQTATAGEVVIRLGDGVTEANTFDVDSGTLVPGDTISRVVDLISESTEGDLGDLTLSTTVVGSSSLLDSDASNGLQMVIQDCSVPWVESGTSPALTYTCAGPAVTSAVLGSRQVLGSGLALANLTTETSPGTDHLLLTLTLPSGAGNTFQALTSTIRYTFDADQRGNLPR